MKIKITNIGAMQKADLELGDLTIICGPNNSGKTYVTYALYGFLAYWQRSLDIIHVPFSSVDRLLTEGSVSVDIQEYIDKASSIMDKCCVNFAKSLPEVFASASKNFVDSSFSVHLSPGDIQPASDFERIMGAAKTNLFSISKSPDSQLVSVSLLVEKEAITIPQHMISRIIGVALKEIVFGNIFPRPFIASAERTGAAIFRKELNFARNKLFENMSIVDKDVDPLDLFFQLKSDYSMPVRANVDFTRQLETVAKQESFISKEHPEVLNQFSGIIGGEYLVTKSDELYYRPKGKRTKLTMDESSSSVRSLLDIGFYIRHVATKDDILIIDEPELNLHPSNQRTIARLMAQLVNLGIKVFITTHSDYIIRELNTLIMLCSDDKRIAGIAEDEDYRPLEKIDASKVKVFIAEKELVMLDGMARRKRCNTLVQAQVDPRHGIEARCFDDSINEINRIQDEIIWGS
jgi:AAA15 family ATPase/GTPase